MVSVKMSITQSSLEIPPTSILIISDITIEVKIISVYTMKPYEGVKVQVHAFLTSAFDGGKWSVSQPHPPFIPTKEPVIPNEYEAWWPLSQYRCFREIQISFPCHISNQNSSFVQPLAQSLYVLNILLQQNAMDNIPNNTHAYCNHTVLRK